MHAKGNDISYCAKEGKSFRIFKQGGTQILKMIYRKAP
jgi:hypothetical protein